MDDRISRRGFLAGGAATLLGAVGLSGLLGASHRAEASGGRQQDGTHDPHFGMHMKGTVDPDSNGFDPLDLLVEWDYGEVSRLPNGQTLREYQFVALDKEIEIAPGVFFPAWTYNGRVPGPTIRAREGDRIRLRFTNGSSHPHTIHFHGIHPFEMDGVPGSGAGGNVEVGQTYTYEFNAEPFGCHLYHCHSLPLKRHIHKGLYGAFIVDPKEGRLPAREFMMMMNGFDTNFDGANEVYAVNTVARAYADRMIPVKVGEPIRVYLINITEFDPLNSFHLHAEFFDYYDHGTTLEPTLRTVDTISQIQAQRGILEFSYGWPGRYMFHAHQSEFAELGWMGNFHVVEEVDWSDALAEAGLGADWDRRSRQGSTVDGMGVSGS
jgi:FtsP/CotA-like multicopper oxidase with cupredoxin domain